MSLQIYRTSEFNHVRESQTFLRLQQLLSPIYGIDTGSPCLLVANYAVNGIESSALIANRYGIFVLSFINEGGGIEKNGNGNWTTDGKTLFCSSGKANPLDEVLALKSALLPNLEQLLGESPLTVNFALVFLHDSRFATAVAEDCRSHGILLLDASHLSVLTQTEKRGLVFTDRFVQSISDRLHLAEQSAATPDTAVQNAFDAYEPEAPTNFFKELENALSLQPDYAKVYSAYNRVFQKCLDQNTSFVRINLGGTFAKTDYLLKEYEATAPVVTAVNDTRVRLRTREEQSETELKRHCLHDLKNLCRFVALIYRCDIPEYLVRLFPQEPDKAVISSQKPDCIRIIVEHWDDEYVYGRVDLPGSEGETKVCYAQGNRYYPYDWTYLKGLFSKGAQLNLVRPYSKAGIVYPELIVFEPDCLIDITAIARCFTNYAESAVVHLLHKIEPAQNSEAIVLGNFAGQLLDEAIHQLPNSHPYAQSVIEFFKNNAFNLLTAGISPEFHEEAQKQKRNIAEALYSGLPRLLQHFDSREGMVEPSFFSEMLGMQGRMDYLQSDFKVLLEQKSGKGQFPYDHFIKPRQKEEHYVQMLLYMALIRYNYHDIYERNGKELHAFLLYSKYHDSLLGLGFAPELIFRALRIRNELTWYELRYTAPNGFTLLGELSADQLNEKHVSNKLWTQFQAPKINGLLAPIHHASPLERAYYYRFLTFIANEHMMSKLGNKTKENSGFASKWHDSLEDKRMAGNIYDRLQLVTPIASECGSIRTVNFRFSENEDNDMSNFRIGDIVIFYPYDEGQEPDARRTMVFRSTISDITADTLSLSLRAAQSDARVFLRDSHRLWAVEHDFIESSYNTLYRGMHAFLSAPQDRRDLLLLQRKPCIDRHRQLKGDYGPFNELSLRVKQARDLFLIIGPPGTGKTSFGMLNTLKEELLEEDASVLVMSYTNRAVDEICSKLHEEHIPFTRIGGGLTCGADYRSNLLSEKVLHCPNIGNLRQDLMSTRVFVGTTTAFHSNLALFGLRQFSLAIIDEASQILEPHLIGLLSAEHQGTPAIRKMVFIGDHKQLPAVVQQRPEVSRVSDLALNAIGLTDCRLSLFERLLRKYRDNPEVTYMLHRQGRMHHDIAAFPNYAFYNNRLTEVPRPHQRTELPGISHDTNGIVNLLRTRRIAFIAADSPSGTASDKVNTNEAEIIAATVATIYLLEKENFNPDRTVGVIVPYRNQIATVRNTIDRYGIPELHDITIDTVERYQGSQRKYILYGFTIQKYYQLSFLTDNVFVDVDGSVIDRKLNVAMTRAEEHLIMVGNAELLANNFTFYKLLEYVKSRHSLFRVNAERYVKGNFEVPPYQPEALCPDNIVCSTSEKFEKAFDRIVTAPIRQGSGSQWPEKLFGADIPVCLDAIGYGRTPIGSRTETPQHALLYCHFYMRRHYYSSRYVFGTLAATITSLLQSAGQRVHFIDLLGGTGAAGIAFAETFLSQAPQLAYTAIEPDENLRSIGSAFIRALTGNRLRYQYLDSSDRLTPQFWSGVSELPSLVVFSLPFVLGRITARHAERLAKQMVDIMQKHPLNAYLIVIQQAEDQQSLNACKVFRQILEPHTRTVCKTHRSFPYTEGQAQWTLYYDILMKS